MVKSEYPEEELLMSEKTSEDEYMQGDWPQNPRSISTASQHEGPSPTRSNSNGENDTSSDGANADLKPHLANRVPLDDRRLRRQIANCNERRRMQSINAGFQSLRSLLPRKDGEKMSKAAILQQTAEYIHSLLDEKDHFLQETNTVKKRRVDYDECMDVEAPEQKPAAVVPPPPPPSTQQQPQQPAMPSIEVIEYLKTIEELKSALCKEQRLRLLLENELLEIRAKSINDAAAAASLGVLRAHSSLFQSTLNTPLKTTPTDSTAFSLPSRDLVHESSTLLAAAAAQNLYGNVVLNGALAQTSLVSPTLPPTHQNSSAINFAASTTSSALAGLPQPVPQRFLLGTNDTKGILRLATSNLEIPSNQSSVFSPADRGIPEQATASPPISSMSTSLAQRNLQAILEAIKHIEGGIVTRSAANASPTLSSAMVR